ncbi:hypothetical protein Droror1_Dr00000680 [Drosera rotundifolia]
MVISQRSSLVMKGDMHQTMERLDAILIMIMKLHIDICLIILVSCANLKEIDMDDLVVDMDGDEEDVEEVEDKEETDEGDEEEEQDDDNEEEDDEEEEEDDQSDRD